MKAYRLVVAAVAFALAAPPVVAQEREQERDLREVQRRVEEAQRQLAEALRELQGAAGDEARRALDRAMEQLLAAQRELRAGRLRDWTFNIERFGPSGAVVYAGRRPMMGVVLRPSAPERDSLGVELMGVTPGGPAEEAGLKVGDVIVRANGESLARQGRRGEAPGDRLVGIIGDLGGGDTLRVEYRRNGQTRTANVILRQMASYPFALRISGDSAFRFLPSPDVELAIPDLPVAPRIRAMLPLRWLDIELVTLDEELGEYFGTRQGLLVVRAPRDEALQLRSGDVILTIDGREPTSPSHAIRILRSYEPGESLAIEIMRNKRRTTLNVTVPERNDGFLWDARRYRDSAREGQRR